MSSAPPHRSLPVLLVRQLPILLLAIQERRKQRLLNLLPSVLLHRSVIVALANLPALQQATTTRCMRMTILFLQPSQIPPLLQLSPSLKHCPRVMLEILSRCPATSQLLLQIKIPQSVITSFKVQDWLGCLLSLLPLRLLPLPPSGHWHMCVIAPMRPADTLHPKCLLANAKQQLRWMLNLIPP